MGSVIKKTSGAPLFLIKENMQKRIRFLFEEWTFCDEEKAPLLLKKRRESLKAVERFTLEKIAQNFSIRLMLYKCYFFKTLAAKILKKYNVFKNLMEYPCILYHQNTGVGLRVFSKIPYKKIKALCVLFFKTGSDFSKKNVLNKDVWAALLAFLKMCFHDLKTLQGVSTRTYPIGGAFIRRHFWSLLFFKYKTGDHKSSGKKLIRYSGSRFLKRNLKRENLFVEKLKNPLFVPKDIILKTGFWNAGACFSKPLQCTANSYLWISSQINPDEASALYFPSNSHSFIPYNKKPYRYEQSAHRLAKQTSPDVSAKMGSTKWISSVIPSLNFRAKSLCTTAHPNALRENTDVYCLAPSFRASASSGASRKNAFIPITIVRHKHDESLLDTIMNTQDSIAPLRQEGGADTSSFPAVCSIKLRFQGKPKEEIEKDDQEYTQENTDVSCLAPSFRAAASSIFMPLQKHPAYGMKISFRKAFP